MLFWNPRRFKLSLLVSVDFIEIKNYINQLGVKSKFPPLKKAINTPKAKLKKIEAVKRRSENNSPPENGRLTPIDLENCKGSIFVKSESVS